MAHFEYSWQWAYRERFEQAGLTAILGCGFDPRVSGVFTAYAAKHYFGEMETLDIVDCNAGDHGKAFATNFNPEINIREITQNGRYYWNERRMGRDQAARIPPRLSTTPTSARANRTSYTTKSSKASVQNFPSIKRARFWMTFGQEYPHPPARDSEHRHGRIDEVEYNGTKIVPLQFLKAVLPNPQDLGENYHGETSIGCRIAGLDKEGKPTTYYIYNNCSHEEPHTAKQACRP